MRPRPDSTPRFTGSGRSRARWGADQPAVTAASVGRRRPAMAREGAGIAIAYLDEHADARETCRLVADEGREALAVAGDIGDPAHAGALVAQVVARFGRLDILVNNAAEQHECDDLTDITPDQLERTFRSNVFGYFHVTRAALPALRESRGTIINTTSVTADCIDGLPKLTDYACDARGAIRGLSAFALHRPAKGRYCGVMRLAPGCHFWTAADPGLLRGSAPRRHWCRRPDLQGVPAALRRSPPSYVFLRAAPCQLRCLAQVLLRMAAIALGRPGAGRR